MCVTTSYFYQLSFHQDKFEYGLATSIHHMNMNGFVLIGEKEENESKIFVNLRHNQSLSCKYAKKKPNSQIMR